MGKKTGLVYVQIGFADGWSGPASAICRAIRKLYPGSTFNEHKHTDTQVYNTITIRIC